MELYTYFSMKHYLINYLWLNLKENKYNKMSKNLHLDYIGSSRQKACTNL